MARHNSKKLGWSARVTLALIVLLGTSQSYAACLQSNLTGTWYFTGITGDTLLAEFWQTDSCKVKVNSTGKIVMSVSQCKFRDADGKRNFDIIGGKLALNSSCRITGRIRFSDGVSSAYFNIDDARLDKGKTVFTMVGRLDIDPDIVSFYTGVKK